MRAAEAPRPWLSLALLLQADRAPQREGEAPTWSTKMLRELTMSEDEYRCLCHLAAHKVGKGRYEAHVIDSVADRLFDRTWQPGQEMSEMISRAARAVSLLARGGGPVDFENLAQTKPLAPVLTLCFEAAHQMYQGRAEPGSAKTALLYAGVLRQLGRLDDEGNLEKAT